jgi:plastocyanin
MAPAHEVLGVRPGAPASEVRDAYRRLARLHHPDRFASAGADARAAAERRMRELNDAYRFLRSAPPATVARPRPRPRPAPRRRRPRPRAVPLAAVTAVVLLLLHAAAGSSRVAAPAHAVEVRVEGGAYDIGAITLPADSVAHIAFVDRDVGYQHNLSIYRSTSDADLHAPLFLGRVVTGPTAVDYELRTPPPGTYLFRCDIFPAMRGIVIVR